MSEQPPTAEKDAHVPVLDYDPEQEAWICADHGMPECRQGDCASLPWPSAGDQTSVTSPAGSAS